jgi:predicted DNA-binding helix-hairpin-helix protein
MAQAFMAYQRSGIAEGLFLSSGVVGSGLRTQDQIIKTAEIIREKFHYQGYLHLKIMPGSERSQVERTMELASRVSVNLEAPNSQRLQLLAPRKAFLEELLQPLRWIEEIRQQMLPTRAWNRQWPSTSTQFVVGAVGESDRELLRTTEYLHRKLNLQRAYFSAFHPVADTPFEAQPAESPLRQLRLYQAAFLMRDYGFSVNEFQIDDTGNLPQSVDPKMAWADQHLRDSPVELNTASLHDLLRVPGIGPAGARAIVNSRRQRSIHQVEDLYNLGVNPTRATPFILMNGKRPAQQLRLW